MFDDDTIFTLCLLTHLRLSACMGSDLLSPQDATEEHTETLRSSQVVLRPPHVDHHRAWSYFPFFRVSFAATLLIGFFAAHTLLPGVAPDVLQVSDSALARRPIGSTNTSLPPPPPAPLGPTGLPMHAATTDEGSSASSSSSEISDRSSSSSSLSSSQEGAPSSGISSSETLSSTSSSASPSIRSDNKVGVYLTAASVARTKFFNDTVDELIKSGGSAVVFDVKGGVVMFHSAAPMANEINLVRPFYDLPSIIQQLHDRGIYVIGRFVAIKDAGFTEKKPETRIKNPKTGKVLSQTWVDPSDETAIQYNMEIICELATAGIDEVNLDYIRFSTAEVGALSVYSGAEKADRVEKFLRAARDTINRCGPQTKLGISTFAILGWKYDVNMETLGQDVIRFAPLVDVISPMAYPATFAPGFYYRPGKDPGSRMYFLVYRTLTGYADFLGPEQSPKIRPWIQGYGVKSKDVIDEIKAVYDAGYCGFTVWNANNAYAPTFDAVQKDGIRPDRCKA